MALLEGTVCANHVPSSNLGMSMKWDKKKKEGQTKQHTLNETLDQILYKATRISEYEM